MAIGKHRNNKRSSGGNSHVSTVVMVVFIAVCILGAWMFTSNSFVSPQKTTRTATFDHSATESQDASSIPIKFPTSTPAFEDNPGDLPNDAIKPDDNREPNEGQTSQPDDQNSSEEDKPNAFNENEEETTSNNDNHDAESANNHEEESTSNNDNHEAESDNSDEHKQHLEGESIDNVGTRDPEQGSMKENLASVVDENPHGLQGKVSVEEEEKQQDHHTQLSEESIMTHQQAEEITDHQSTETFQKDPESERNQETRNDQQEGNFGKQEIHQEDGNGGGNPQEENPMDNQSGDGKGASQDSKYHISDDEQENRMENQQQQEEQSQGGETSEDQVQHDEEAPIDSHSVAEETKAQLENMEGQHSSNQGNQETKESVNSKKSNSPAESSFAVGESSSEIPKESKESKKAWKTQADQSENQKERGQSGGQVDGSMYGYTWLLCNETAGGDFIPCLDNEKAISKLRSRNHYEHRERHCPEEGPTCLVPLPQSYKTSIEWPQSRDKVNFQLL